MRPLPTAAFFSIALTTSASAHPGFLHGQSFAAGVVHPFSGLDHIAAMVAVGLWAAIKGNRALWIWPSTFVAAMLVGGVLGLAQVAVPFVEPGIMASVVVLGILLTLAVDAPVWAGSALIGIFAIFHGHAHGAEVSHSLGGVDYVAGFVVATVALHAAGIALALTLRETAAYTVNRFAGLACLAIGFGLCTGAL